MDDEDLVYIDGAFLPRHQARISPFDRGFLFAHAAYEVTAVYNGRLIDLEPHEARLRRTLADLEIEFPNIDFAELHHDIISRNSLHEGLVYLQVTAGDQGPRDYYGPETLTPTVFMFTTKKTLIGEKARNGLTAITLEDSRWKRRDLKTTQLLTQTLAYRAARRAGADTAIMHEDGSVTEAASANLWIVTKDGELATRNLSHALLPGITRQRVAALLEGQKISVSERAFTLQELQDATEAFTSSTGVVIAPVLKLDGQSVGCGQAGPVTRTVQKLYYEYIGADLSKIDFL